MSPRYKTKSSGEWNFCNNLLQFFAERLFVYFCSNLLQFFTFNINKHIERLKLILYSYISSHSAFTEFLTISPTACSV